MRGSSGGAVERGPSSMLNLLTVSVQFCSTGPHLFYCHSKGGFFLFFILECVHNSFSLECCFESVKSHVFFMVRHSI